MRRYFDTKKKFQLECKVSTNSLQSKLALKEVDEFSMTMGILYMSYNISKNRLSSCQKTSCLLSSKVIKLPLRRSTQRLEVIVQMIFLRKNKISAWFSSDSCYDLISNNKQSVKIIRIDNI